MKNATKTVKILRYTARIFLILVVSFWFVFALLSGAEELGGGLMGVVKNFPNALPWLLLFALVFLAWKWELVSGIIIAALGILTIFMFDTLEEGVTFLLISVPLMFLGGALVSAWYLERKANKAISEIKN
jgi:hypothetical protein